MDLHERLARRQGRHEDMKAIAGLALIVCILLAGAMLPGFLADHASTVHVPAQQEARR